MTTQREINTIKYISSEKYLLPMTQNIIGQINPGTSIIKKKNPIQVDSLPNKKLLIGTKVKGDNQGRFYIGNKGMIQYITGQDTGQAKNKLAPGR